jgi:PEP-CTERM motif
LSGSPWTLGGSNVSFTGVNTAASFGGLTAPHGGSSQMDFGALTCCATLSQTVTTTAGAAYTLSFWVANEFSFDTSGFDASWDGVSLPGFPHGAASPFVDYAQSSFPVIGTGSDQLQFSAYNPAGFWHLDDVSVDSSVPEPASLLVLAVGSVGFLAFRKRGRA